MKERTAQSLYRPTYKTTIKVCSQRQKASQYDSLNITVWASWVVMAKAGPASTPLPPPSALTRVKSIISAWPGQCYINYNKPTAGPFKCTSSNTLGQILNGAGHTRLDYHWKKSSGKTTSHHFGCICAKLANWYTRFLRPLIYDSESLSIVISETNTYNQLQNVKYPYIINVTLHSNIR